MDLDDRHLERRVEPGLGRDSIRFEQPRLDLNPELLPRALGEGVAQRPARFSPGFSDLETPRQDRAARFDVRRPAVADCGDGRAGRGAHGQRRRRRFVFRRRLGGPLRACTACRREREDENDFLHSRRQLVELLQSEALSRAICSPLGSAQQNHDSVRRGTNLSGARGRGGGAGRPAAA